MSEEQITDIKIFSEDLSEHDTGGGIRQVKAKITVDNTLPPRRQREALIHEMLGVYLGIVISTSDLEEIAKSINQAICEWEEIGG